jgi:hypothetical protein
MTTSTNSSEPYETACVIMPISADRVAKLEACFPRVLYRPDAKVSADEAAQVDVWYTTWTGLPDWVERLEQIPRTRAVQLSSGECGGLASAVGARARAFAQWDEDGRVGCLSDDSKSWRRPPESRRNWL